MLIGADVEFFVKNALGDIVPAFMVVPQDKNNPIIKKDIKVYYDNVLLEFNIPPSSNIKNFLVNIANGINLTESLIRPNFIDTSASVYLSPDCLDDARALEVGCDVEYNAYSMKPNNSVKDAVKNTSMRTSGGHIHISGENDSDAINDKTLHQIFVYMLDLFVGIPSILLEDDVTQKDRRKLFGKAGSFRIKPYGIEYRVLSSWWTRKPEYTALIYRICEFVFEFMNNQMWKKFWNFNQEALYGEEPQKAYSCFGYDVDLVTRTINECNIMSAEKLYYFISNFLPNDIVEEINLHIKKQRS